MTSNYLSKKYPDTGYNIPVNMPNLLVKFWEAPSGEDEKLEKEFNSINKFPCTNVCECGEEWESEVEDYQEGCYPYIQKICKECNSKNEIECKNIAEEKRISDILNSFDLTIPPRYRGKLTTPIHRKLLTSICSIVWGGFGTGKTWEAYTIAKELIKAGEIKTFKLITEIDLLNDLKDGFDNMPDKIKKYKNYDFLILDEAGKNNDSDFNKAQLFGILNHRYDWEMKTLLICNANKKEEIRELLPTATLDRFRECVIEMEGQSLRYAKESLKNV